MPLYNNRPKAAMSTTQLSAESLGQYKAKAYSSGSSTSPLAPATILRREPDDDDIQLEILFCGICHSDLHTVRSEWGGTVYPCVPGHEIVGRVTKVGSAVTKFKPGDLAAVGCMVDSDRNCDDCQAGLEQFCPNVIYTYNSPDKHLGGVTYGGYSDSIVVKEDFVPCSFQTQSSRSCASLVRRNYNIFPSTALGSHQGQEGWRSRSRRAGPYGSQVCSCAWSARRGVYHFA